MDWHEVALGAIAMLVALGGYLWTTTAKRIDKTGEYMGKLFEKLETHANDDSTRFAEVMSKMNEYHIETLGRINGRWKDRD